MNDQIKYCIDMTDSEGFEDEATEARQQYAALTERVTQLEALVRYAQHDPNCSNKWNRECECGYNQVRLHSPAPLPPRPQTGQAGEAGKLLIHDSGNCLLTWRGNGAKMLL